MRAPSEVECCTQPAMLPRRQPPRRRLAASVRTTSRRRGVTATRPTRKFFPPVVSPRVFPRSPSSDNSMPRFRTAAAATLFVIPIVAGGFFLQASPTRANAVLFDQVMSLVRNQYVDSIPVNESYEKAAHGLVKELNDPYSELLSPKE